MLVVSTESDSSVYSVQAQRYLLCEYRGVLNEKKKSSDILLHEAFSSKHKNTYLILYRPLQAFLLKTPSFKGMKFWALDGTE